MPADDGLIRKRPKAVADEGTATAFVSCALAHQSDQFNTVESFNVQFINRQATSVQINCTLVDGIGDCTYSAAVATSVTVHPGSRIGLTGSFTSDNGNARYTVPALSCALPASTEVVGVAYQALDEIGS